jgi:hypothetical protein
VAYLTISQLQADKPALLEFVRAAAQGILTQLQGSPGGAAAVGPATGGTPAAAATAGLPPAWPRQLCSSSSSLQRS